eukprot:scaffold1146_cov339-Pavlova_lutheri.AAC.6
MKNPGRCQTGSNGRTHAMSWLRTGIAQERMIRGYFRLANGIPYENRSSAPSSGVHVHNGAPSRQLVGPGLWVVPYLTERLLVLEIFDDFSLSQNLVLDPLTTHLALDSGAVQGTLPRSHCRAVINLQVMPVV